MDDDADDRLLVKDALAESGLPVELHTVEDGEQLLKYLREQVRRPNLILLDLNMPRKDGRTALREIKADAALRRIPIVVLTTSQAEEDIFRSYQLGASSFITKPASFEELVKMIGELTGYWFGTVSLPPAESGVSHE